MQQTVEIFCRNNGQTIQVPTGSTLEETYRLLDMKMEYGPITAKVNNKVEGMHFRTYKQKTVEFLDMHSPSGIRAYTRTLFFILAKASHDLWPECKVSVDIPVSNGYYVNLRLGRPVTPDDVAELRQKMQEIINAAIPIHRHETTTEKAIQMFHDMGSVTKVKLLQSTGRLYTTYYDIDGYNDYFYGALLTNTSQIYLFGLEYYSTGCCCASPPPTIPPSSAPSCDRTRCSRYSRSSTAGRTSSTCAPSATSTRLYRRASHHSSYR